MRLLPEPMLLSFSRTDKLTLPELKGHQCANQCHCQRERRGKDQHRQVQAGFGQSRNIARSKLHQCP